MLQVFVSLLSCTLAWSNPSTESILIEGQHKFGPSLYTIHAGDLEKNQSPFIVDILRQIPGLNIFATGGPGQPTSVSIRGAKSEHVLVLIDGLEVNDPSSPARGYDFSNLSANHIESIEVYKGASSSAFGSEALGGVISIKTKAANQTKKTFFAEGGSFLSFRSHLTATGLTPYFKYSISGSHQSSESFSAAQTSNPKDKDGFNNTSANIKLTQKITPLTQVIFSGMFNQFHTDLDYSGGIDDPNFTSKQQQFLLGSSLLTSFLNQKLEFIINSNANILTREYKNPSDSLNPEDYFENFNAQNLKTESKFSYKIDQKSSLDFNLQLRHESADSNKTLNGLNENQSKSQQNTFSQSIHYNNKWSELALQVGLRHDQFSSQNKSFINQSLAIEYNFNQIQSLVSFNYSSGIKSPSLFQLYSEFGSKNLRPELSASYDLSFEKVFFNKSLLSLTYFNTDYKNLIDFDMSTSKYKNISKTMTQGIEIAVSHLLIPSVTLDISYQFLQAKDLNTKEPLLRRPRHTVKSSLMWNKNKWSIVANALFVGHRYDLDPLIFERIEQPSYFLFNTLVRYEVFKNLVLNLRLENVFNKSYQEIAGYQTSKRAFYIGTQLDF